MAALTGVRQSPETGENDRRENPRICVGTRALLCAASSVGEPVPVVLRDLSNSGVGMLVDAELPVGAECWIYIPKADKPDDLVGVTCEIVRCDRGGFELSAYVVAAVFIEGEPPEMEMPVTEEEKAKPAEKSAPHAPRPNSQIFSQKSAVEKSAPAPAEDAPIASQLSDFFSHIAPTAAPAKAAPAVEPMPTVKDTPLPSIEPEKPKPAPEPEAQIESAPVEEGEANAVEQADENDAQSADASQASSTAQSPSEEVEPALTLTEATAAGEKLSWNHIRRMAKITHAQLAYLQRTGNRLDDKHAGTNPALRQDVEKARKVIEQLNSRLNSLRNPEAEEVAEKCARRAAKRRAKYRAQQAGQEKKDETAGPNGQAPPAA